eukprot:TRINITY_DN63025_c0_g1_i1.p1 TRINITY_DN63025_c0_g1~~TRINITY_DN63025_c0_g1_i1.p1  ORF type:complete len:236 (-),score=25.29 TRINITY_DN63025_c0_g1_i1:170-877(-)
MRCANPECEHPKNTDPEYSQTCPGFCCEKCMGRFNGEEWAFQGKKKHNAFCSGAQPKNKSSGGGADGFENVSMPSHFDPTNPMHWKAAMKGMMKGGSMKGGPMAMKGMLASSLGAWGCGKGPQKGGYPGVEQTVNKSKNGRAKAKQGGPAQQGAADEGDKFPANQKVWIGKLPKGTKKDELKEYFEQIGEVLYAWVSKGTTGVVAFGTPADAQMAIDVLNDMEFNGNVLQVTAYE